MRRAIIATTMLLAGFGLVAWAQSMTDADRATSLVLRESSIDTEPGLDAKPPAAVPDVVPSEPSGEPAIETERPVPREAVVAAKSVFGAAATPAPLAARAIGFYSRGCLAGAVPVPIDGEVWQVMRLSRNRNWGHPQLVALVQRLAEDAAANDGWPGLLVGDLSQPRGGPMLTGHSSHQIGLDADVWLTPMPERRFSATEREQLAATSMLGRDGIHADTEVFTPYHAALIRRAASYPEVERVLIHPGIKKAMCQETGADRSSFHKIRPYWGHHYHMHIRIGCPRDSVSCKGQAPAAGDDGCGREIDDWLASLKKPPKPEPSKPEPQVAIEAPKEEKRPVTLDDLPNECRAVLTAGSYETEGSSAVRDRKPTRAARSTP